jgi:hypothetical protein
MPDSLKAAMRAFDIQRPIQSLDADDRPSEDFAPSSNGHIVMFSAEDQLSDDDHAFIRRIAPPAAE